HSEVRACWQATMMPDYQKCQQTFQFCDCCENSTGSLVIWSSYLSRWILFRIEQILLKRWIIFPDVMQQARVTCELFATKYFAIPCRGIRDIAEMLFQPLSFPQAIFCMSNIDHTYSS